jgi:hypothetical protein
MRTEYYTDKSIRVYREQTAATIQELPSTQNIAHISESNMGGNNPSSQYDPVLEVSVGDQMTTQQREKLEGLIRNTQVFDYPGNRVHHNNRAHNTHSRI